MHTIIINSKKVKNIDLIFLKNGYIAFRNIFDIKKINRIKNDFEEIINKYEHKMHYNSSIDEKIINLNLINQNALYEFQLEVSNLKSLKILSEDLNEIIPQIYKNDINPVIESVGYVLGIPNSSRLSYDWHQDATYHDESKKINVWFPIFYEAELKNGAMSFLKNSHRLGKLEFEKIKTEQSGYTTNLIKNMNPLLNSMEIICKLQVQDCVIFHDNLIHKSNKNLSNKCRIAGVFKYSFAVHSKNNISIVGV